MLNSSLANMMGRSDLAAGQSGRLTAPPTTVTLGGSGGADNTAGGALSGGRGSVIMLMALIGSYAAFVWWVRPHLA